MIHDLENVGDVSTLDADICIIGTGVAGLSIAREFLGSKYKVMLLEGGGIKDEARSQKLYISDVVGMPHDGIHNGRFRVLGGSSTRWGAQLMTMQEFDLRKHDFSPNSGWPININDISPYYDRAQQVLGVNLDSFEEDLWETLNTEPLLFNKELFRYRFSKWAGFSKRNLAKTIAPEIANSKNIDIYIHANATEIVPNEQGSSIQYVRARNYSGKEVNFRARVFILCCGTIETARILLASRSVIPTGIGNENDLVGRYFQDHITIRIAELNPTDKKVFGKVFDPVYRGETMHSSKLVLTEEVREKYKCLNAMGHVVFGLSVESGFYELRSILRALQAKKNPLPSPMGAWRLLRYSHEFVRLVLGKQFLGRRLSPVSAKSYLQIECEQSPQPDSRLLLTDRVDDLGMPVVSLDWRLGDLEQHSVHQYMKLFSREWERMGLGTAEWHESLLEDRDKWLTACRDTYHQLGTTRMSNDPHDGVVDIDLKVHGINNLYVGSCSVLPTGGSSNPTLTMMALCLRVADHIKQNLS